MSQFQPPIPVEHPPLPTPAHPKTPLAVKLFVAFAVVIVGAIVIVGIIASSQGSSSPSSGTSTYTFSGNGVQQTQMLNLSSDWTLSWTCDPSSFTFGSYNVQVFVHNTDGSLLAVAVNTICSSSNTSGSTEMHQGGNVYLEINSEAAWTLTVTG